MSARSLSISIYIDPYFFLIYFKHDNRIISICGVYGGAALQEEYGFISFTGRTGVGICAGCAEYCAAARNYSVAGCPGDAAYSRGGKSADSGVATATPFDTSSMGKCPASPPSSMPPA